MKRIAIGIVAGALALLAAACGGSNAPANQAPAPASTPPAPPPVTEYIEAPAPLYIGPPDGPANQPVYVPGGTPVTVHFSYVNQHGVTMDRVTTDTGITGNVNAADVGP